MSETNSNTQKQKPKTCKLAIISFLLGVLGLLTSYFYNEILIYPETAKQLCFRIMCVMGVVGLIFSMVALLRVKKSKRMLRGLTLSIVAMVLCLSIIGIGYLITRPRHCTASPIVCGTNLRHLGTAMLIYGLNNGHYPEPNQWCDLLLNDGEVEAEEFICPDSLRTMYIVCRLPFKSKTMLISPFTRKGRCNYAMNPNCHPNSPPDTVLLFETKAGWNQHGGKEILTKENHKGDGSGIVFCDAHVTFERRPWLLNWGDEQKQ